jgi:uncharacterized protein (TIGR02391 family)
MALNETKRQLLARILDQVKETGEYPERERFRADIGTANWGALEQLISNGFLFQEPHDCLRLLPTFAGLAEMCGHTFAASEVQRALAILPVLQSEYKEGLHKKRCSVAELAGRKEVQCSPDEMRRTLRTDRVRRVIGTWDPMSPITFETFTLTAEALLLTPDDLNPSPRPSPDPGSLDDFLEGLTDEPPREPPPATAAQHGLTPVPRPSRAGAFDSRRFHAGVEGSARKLFLENNPREALERATRAALDAVRKKAKRGEDGDDLVNGVFSEKNPILRLPDITTESGKSEQRGVLFLAKALVALVRNPNAHELRAHTDDEALEGLGVISLFYRYLDRMTLQTIPAGTVAMPPAASQRAGKPAAPSAAQVVIPAPAMPPSPMLDDEAKVLLKTWLSKVADQGSSPPIMSPDEIESQARVPVAQVVALLVTVAHENEHFGVTVKRLQGGKFHLEVGAQRIRTTRTTGGGFGDDGWES